MRLAGLLLISSVAASCNYRQLRCVVCRKHVSVDTLSNANDGVKTVSWHKSIGKGLHRNHKHVYVTKEFAPNGKLLREQQEAFITTYNDFGKIMLRSQTIVYNLSNDSSRKTVEVYRRGKLSRTVRSIK